MNGNRMPTLFEILNRFSKPPVDLWSFYVFLKEQYGGVEYLEFWLDCASYASIRNQLDIEIRKSQALQHDGSAIMNANDTSGHSSVLFDSMYPSNMSESPNNSNPQDKEALPQANTDAPATTSTMGSGRANDDEKQDTISRLSDMLMKMKSSQGGSDSSGYMATPINQYHAHIQETGDQSRPSSFPSHYSVTKKTMHESVLRIVSLYLTPGAEKEIDLPCDQNGWSIAEDIRQIVNKPEGLDTPNIFGSATTYVFEVLEREALPAFLLHRALSNIQPLSTTLRLFGGLLGLFAAFWLSFVFVLLDWEPISVRCWVILPYFLGWYLTISALYHVDPLLVAFKRGERDGGGFIKIQEEFVHKMLIRRGLFVASAVILMTAAFSVLFIFVPGYRL